MQTVSLNHIYFFLVVHICTNYIQHKQSVPTPSVNVCLSAQSHSNQEQIFLSWTLLLSYALNIVLSCSLHDLHSLVIHSHIWKMKKQFAEKM
jgi:hypothetical protein